MVISKDHDKALLIIKDLASRLLSIGIVDSKGSSLVEAKTGELLEEWKPFLHIITSDNGKEFTHHQKIAQSFERDYFFAKPYQSW